MNNNVLLGTIEELQKVLKRCKIKLVLMGGIAASVLAKPRATFDVDGMISATEDEIEKALLGLKRRGFKFDQKQPLKKIQGLPFLSLYFLPHKVYVDLFLASNEFQEGVIRRAKGIRYHNINLKLISPEDLILIKLQSGREKDMEDVRDIITANKDILDHNYLKIWSRKLGIATLLEDELRSLRLRK